MIVTGLSKQKPLYYNLKSMNQVNFTRKLERNENAAIFFHF